jgi:hypothetical protein
MYYLYTSIASYTWLQSNEIFVDTIFHSANPSVKCNHMITKTINKEVGIDL